MSNISDPGRLHQQALDALVFDIIPFWENHSLDPEGGYFTCLDRQGNVFDTDKFIWLQGRQVWTFSMLYNTLEKKEEWLSHARHGWEFLRAHGMDAEGRWYFALTRHGDPLVQPYNIFSDCFAAMGAGQYALASGDDQAREIAARTFRAILRRRENPQGIYTKTVPWSRPMRSFALPMILLNLTRELAWLLPPGETATLEDDLLRELLSLFLDRDQGIVYEHVAPDGSHPDTFDGRLLNPGHAIEGMWFLMDLAQRRNDRALMDTAIDITLRTLERAWDREYGGIYYFMDVQAKPPQQLEWDQKLWWVHIETLIALAMGCQTGRRAECWPWYERVHEYTWARFPDPEYGEWYGYLNRRGEVLLPLKGGKWKGCFHVPRGLWRLATVWGPTHG